MPLDVFVQLVQYLMSSSEIFAAKWKLDVQVWLKGETSATCSSKIFCNPKARISSFFIICMPPAFPVVLLSRYYDEALPRCFAELWDLQEVCGNAPNPPRCRSRCAGHGKYLISREIKSVLTIRNGSAREGVVSTVTKQNRRLVLGGAGCVWRKRPSDDQWFCLRTCCESTVFNFGAESRLDWKVQL